MCAFASSASADINLYVDPAPNVSGSPDYAGWWTSAKTDVVAGTFVNMGSGYLGTPGVLNADPYDEIVYSTGDLGKRMHWIYWLPGETVADLTGRFQVKQVMDWDGVAYAWGADVDGPEVGWYTPTSWVEYGGGVIGTFGNAWWAGDNEALPYSTDSNPWNETDQADIDALRDMVLEYQTFTTGYVRIRDDETSQWVTQQITVNVVPVPAAVLLGMLGFGVAGLKLRKLA